MSRSARLNPITVVLCAAAIALVGLAASLTGRPTAASTARATPTDPQQEPDKFAWETFIKINMNSATAGNNNVVWETWADTGLVYGDPEATPEWPSGGVETPLKLRPNLKQILRTLKPTADKQGLIFPEAIRKQLHLDKHGKQQFFLPPSGQAGMEVRMNRPAFKFIRDNNLWFRQGQIAFFNSPVEREFPKDAVEVKAVWEALKPGQVKEDFHWQTGANGQVFVLTALHLTTKDLKNWFWATFEHASNPNAGAQIPFRDTFGVSNGTASPALLQMIQSAGLAAAWKNYRLHGTQLDFTDGSGVPAILGNSRIEGGFMKSSSCITCHIRSSISASGGELAVFKKPNPSEPTAPQEGFVGQPDATWFTLPVPVFKRDFVWSLENADTRTATAPPSGGIVSFAADVLPMFRAVDISHMKTRGFPLDDYAFMSQAANAQNVFDHLTGAVPPLMPPNGKWPQPKLDKFKAWMDGGLKP
jgi:hypothetical protein